jgi:hypothetical protein
MEDVQAQFAALDLAHPDAGHADTAGGLGLSQSGPLAGSTESVDKPDVAIVVDRLHANRPCSSVRFGLVFIRSHRIAVDSGLLSAPRPADRARGRTPKHGVGFSRVGCRPHDLDVCKNRCRWSAAGLQVETRVIRSAQHAWLQLARTAFARTDHGQPL